MNNNRQRKLKIFVERFFVTCFKHVFSTSDQQLCCVGETSWLEIRASRPVILASNVRYFVQVV